MKSDVKHIHLASFFGCRSVSKSQSTAQQQFDL